MPAIDSQALANMIGVRDRIPTFLKQTFIINGDMKLENIICHEVRINCFFERWSITFAGLIF